MGRSIGMVEFVTVSAGVQGADLMLKTSAVSIMEAQTVCPGKYIVIIDGRLGAVNEAVEAARRRFEPSIIDSFVLGNPHESVFKALNNPGDTRERRALGTLETFSAAAIFVAADAAAKAAHVELFELRVARGMCGKSYLFLTGEIAAVDAAIERAKKIAGESDMYLDSAVIANPDGALWEAIVKEAGKVKNASH